MNTLSSLRKMTHVTEEIDINLLGCFMHHSEYFSISFPELKKIDALRATEQKRMEILLDP